MNGLFRSRRSAILCGVLAACISLRATAQNIPQQTESDSELQANLKLLTASQISAIQNAIQRKVGRDTSAVFSTANSSGELGANSRRLDMAIMSTLRLQPPDVDANAAPWEMFVNTLTQKVSRVPNASLPGLQVVGAPQAAVWNDPQFGNYYLWRTVCDAEPTWGPTYIPSSRQVTDGYQVFLTNIAIPPSANKNAQKDFERAQRKLEDIEKQTQAIRNGLGASWKDFDSLQQPLPKARQMSFDQWYALNAGRQIGELKQKKAPVVQDLVAAANQAGGGYQQLANAILDFENDAFFQNALAPDGTLLRYRTCNTSPSLDTFVNEGKANATAGRFSDMTFHFDRTSARTHSENTTWSTNASWFGFINVGASGSSELLDVSNNAFAMDFSAARFGVFTLTPGNWFHGVALQSFGNGPWLANGPVAQGIIQLFQSEGVFALMPAQIVVAFRPRVKVTLSASQYSAYRTSISAGGGFSIGPFGFGGKYQKNTADIHFDDANNTITAEDNTDTPQIMAVISFVLPKFTLTGPPIP